jgi:transcriptional regulator GlxA family with amidase domain
MSDSTTDTAKAPLVIGVVFFDGVFTLDWVGPATYLELLPMIGVPVKFVTISNKTGRIQDDTKVSLHALVHYKDAPDHLDILLVPGGASIVEKDPEFLAYIAKVTTTAKYVLSVCTGSNTLAAAGVLAGKRATTNKMYFTQIANAHPATEWVRQARWVVDGKWWTSSGVSAGLDMGNAFIRAVYGDEHADEMARFIESVPNQDPSNDPFVGLIKPN